MDVETLPSTANILSLEKYFMPASTEETVVNKTKNVIFMEFTIYLFKLATPHSLSVLGSPSPRVELGLSAMKTKVLESRSRCSCT